jgi:hypothetical protein
MRNLLLTSAAVTALLIGLAAANAQTRPEQQPPAASSQQNSPTTGAAQSPDRQDKSKAGRKSGASEMQNDRSTTGQSQSQSQTKGANDGGPPAALPKAGSSSQKNDRSTGGQSQSELQKNDTTQGSPPAAQPKGRSSSQKNDRSTTGQSQSESQMNDTSQGSPPSPQPKGRPSSQKSDRPTTGQSQSEPTQGNQPAAQPKAGSSSQKGDRPTGGQSQSEPQTKGTTQGSPSAAQPNRAEQRQSPSGTTSQGSQTGTTQGSTRAGAQGSSTSTVAVTPEHQARFNEVIEKQRIRSVDNVNVSLSVGTSLPPSVPLYDVPRDIVTVYPEFRGKKFVVVRDEIVVVEPRTRKVVAVIPRSGRGTTGTTTSVRQTTSSRLQLPPEKRRIIHETIIREQSAPRCEDVRVTVGEQVPQTIRLSPLPEIVIRDVPEVRSYQFCIKDNEVLLVDPGEHRIVEVID